MSRARRSLTAAGVVPTYDLLYGSQCGLFFEEHVREAGFREVSQLWWPTEAHGLDPHFGVFREDDRGAVYRLPDGTLAHVHLRDDSISVTVAGATREAVGEAASMFRGLYPASFVNTDGDTRVPVTFWSNSRYGPQPRLRRIEATTWEPIVGNYTAAVRDELAKLMAWDEPGEDGQLILWQGPPGTGKTWALRALASEWAAWAEFNYITDPDSFFVDDPSYMVEVLLSESYMVMDSGGSVFEEQAEGKWRVLILEDTGELLSANAKEKYGQGLSRLLNVVDGMIGQGLRVLCLVTTNDELGELNEAVRRPGRCASQIVFGPLDAEEAQTWTGDPAATAGTIAELYGRYGKADVDPTLDDDSEDGELLADGRVRLFPWNPLVASLDCGLAALYLDNFAADDVVAEIARVAADHQEEAVGYGETAWDAATKSVLYVCGDWTDPDPIGEDFLAIDGVEGFVHEAEALPDGWWDAQVVYPDDPPRWVTEPEQHALEALVALASEPLELGPEPVVAAAPPPDPLREHLERSDRMTAGMLDALGKLAAKETPAPTFHLHFPQHQLGVTVERQDISVPVTVEPTPVELTVQPSPVEVRLPEQAAPTVNVEVAAADPTPVHVDVHVPDQPVPHVEVTIPPRPSAVVVDFDEHGRKVFTTVHDDLEEEA